MYFDSTHLLKYTRCSYISQDKLCALCRLSIPSANTLFLLCIDCTHSQNTMYADSIYLLGNAVYTVCRCSHPSKYTVYGLYTLSKIHCSYYVWIVHILRNTLCTDCIYPPRYTVCLYTDLQPQKYTTYNIYGFVISPKTVRHTIRIVHTCRKYTVFTVYGLTN